MTYKNKYQKQYEIERQGQFQEQETVVLSAYDKQVAQDIFLMTMEVLEKYIEKANYYFDWQIRRKIGDENVKREFDDVEEAESVLSSNLLGLKIAIKNKPPFLRDELREEFYRWINVTGIDIVNISPQAERLKHWLFEINEVLDGRGERFVEEVAKEAREHVKKMSDEEYERKMNEAFVAWNGPLNKERSRAQSLKDKTYNDVESEKKFGGDKEKGEKVFNQIANDVSSRHGEFDYYQKHQQQSQNSNHLTNNGAIINGEEYEEIPANSIEVNQQQVDDANRKQQELAQIGSNAKFWIPLGVGGGGFIALITAFGIRVFKPSLR